MIEKIARGLGQQETVTHPEKCKHPSWMESKPTSL